jgi:hypothetical protein
VYVLPCALELYRGVLHDEKLVAQVNRLVDGIRTVAGFSRQPLPSARIDKARRLFREYVKVLVTGNQQAATSKVHDVSET